MYAIVQTGSKQYRVQKGDIIHVELLNAEPGQLVDLQDVLFVSKENGDMRIGQPTIPGGVVRAQYLAVVKGPKGHSVKYKRRKNQYRKFGFRQQYSQLQIMDINV